MGEAKRRQHTGAPAPRKHRNKKPALIAVVALVVLAIVVGAYLLTTPPAPTSDDLPVAAPNAAPFPAALDQYGTSIGAEDAPVVVREFADYQCPACASFSSASQRLKAEYVESGPVRLSSFVLPLRQHPNGTPAGQSALCAGDQRQDCAMHDNLYSSKAEYSGANLPLASFIRYAG